MLKAYTEKGLTEAEALMVLEDDGETCKRVGIQPAGLQEKIYRQRRARVDEMIAAVVTETDNKASFSVSWDG